MIINLRREAEALLARLGVPRSHWAWSRGAGHISIMCDLQVKHIAIPARPIKAGLAKMCNDILRVTGRTEAAE